MRARTAIDPSLSSVPWWFIWVTIVRPDWAAWPRSGLTDQYHCRGAFYPARPGAKGLLEDQFLALSFMDRPVISSTRLPIQLPSHLLSHLTFSEPVLCTIPWFLGDLVMPIVWFKQ